MIYSNQSQNPSGAERLVKTGRFTGDGKLQAMGIDGNALLDDLRGVRARIAAIEEEGVLPPARGKGLRDQVIGVAKDAGAIVGLSMGTASTAGDAVRHYRRSRGDSGSGKGPSPEHVALSTPLLNLLAVRSAGAQAKAAQELSAQIGATGAPQPELVALAGELNGARERVTVTVAEHARAARAEVLQSLTGEIVGGEPNPVQQRIHAAAEAIFAKFDGSGPIPDVLSSEVVAQTALHLFGKPDAADDSGAALAEVLETLRDISPAELARKTVDAMTLPDGIRDGMPMDGTVHLACALTLLPGGGGLISKMMAREGFAPAQQEALRVALLAANGMQQELHDKGSISIRQIQWLTGAAKHAAGLVSAGADGACGTPVNDRQARLQRTAYRGVQNDFMTNEPGSPYDEANQKLSQFAAGQMEQTAQRNVRAASGRLGRLANWATAGHSKVSKGDSGGITGAARNLAAKLPGAEQTVWRKSALKGLTQSASTNGLLPTRHESLDTLDRTARDVRAALEARSLEPVSSAQPTTPQHQQAALGRLMLATLDHLKLGTADGVRADEATCKRLGRAFFDKIAALHPEGMQHLGSKFADEWEQLRGKHPNAGHVLKLVLDHMDVRALLDGTPPSDGNLMISPSLMERGERTDRLVNEAIQEFSNLAGTVKAVAQGVPDSPQVQALALLAETLAATLAAATPKAALGAMRIDTFEAVENKLTKQWRASHPQDQVPDWQTAKREVVASWPDELQQAWATLKEAGPDVGRVLRAVTDAIARGVPEQPLDPSAASTSRTPVTLRAALKQAGVALQALQRDVHANRFERAVADTLTLFNDVRTPRDASAVIESMTQRISLGERLRNSDARRFGLDIGRMISTPISTSPVVLSPIVGGSIVREGSMDINMSGSTLQVWIGDTKAKGGGLGLNVGLRGDLGETDHQFNVDDENAGLALRFDVRAEGGYESSQMDGITLRVARVSGHEDVHRRELGAALMELVDPGSMHKQAGDPYPDRLAALLDRHPRLVVSNLSNTKTSRTGETSGGAVLIARTKGERDRSAQARLETNHMIRLGGGVSAAAKTVRQRSAQTESNGQLKVEEFKLSANQRGDVKANAYAQIGLLPVDTQRGDGGQIDRRRKIAWAPLLRGGGVEYAKQFMSAGVDTTLRIVTDKGKTWPDQSQMIREHESLDSFLADVEARQYQFATAMTGKDDVDGAPMHEKMGRGWERMRETIEQGAKAAGPNMSFIMVTKLLPEVALARDNLEALAQVAERSGDHDRAASLRAAVDTLLSNHDSWTAGNMQFKTKAKKELSQSATLNIFQGKGAAESTRLHEFLPLGAQNVGRTPNMPAGAPVDHSARWTAPEPRRKTLGDFFHEGASNISPDVQLWEGRSLSPQLDKTSRTAPLTWSEHSGQPEVPVQGRVRGDRGMRVEVPPPRASFGRQLSPARSEPSASEPRSPEIPRQRHAPESPDTEVFYTTRSSFSDPPPADWAGLVDSESETESSAGPLQGRPRGNPGPERP